MIKILFLISFMQYIREYYLEISFFNFVQKFISITYVFVITLTISNIDNNSSNL